jgi:LmbE family N-acetylglucosaminyl deacetylase
MNETRESQLGTILSVWAHPDDETYLAGGVMAAAADRGDRVVCVSMTAGELGTDDPETWPPLRLARRRMWEAGAAMGVLGVTDHRFVGMPDGALARLDEEGVSVVGALIDEVDPDTILTFGPDGITFHPDHIAVSRWVTEAWRQRRSRARLLYATNTVEQLTVFGELYEEWGIYMTEERPVGAPTTQLALRAELVGWQLERKLTALAAMVSQTSEVMARMNPEIYAMLVAEETFVDAATVALQARTNTRIVSRM